MVSISTAKTGNLDQAAGKTVIVTGAASGIGAATAALYNKHGANVVVADLQTARDAAERTIQGFAQPSKAIFIPANILNWAEMKAMFTQTVTKFGKIDIVVANAGILETKPVLNMADVDENGDPMEPREAFKVIDVNVKGTLNTIRLAMHHMAKTGGSIVLVSSTSGYSGGTGAAAYVASKHGVVGLLRASQAEAQKLDIRVNGIAPFFSPTSITSAFVEQWKDSGLESNSPEEVGRAIATVSLDEAKKGECVLVAGRILRELETSRASILPTWFGQDVVDLMRKGGDFFNEEESPAPRL